MTKLTDLIAELEAAEAGSRELDVKVAKINGDIEPDASGPVEFMGGYVAPFTSSVDAALTLVPEGWVTMHAGQSSISGTWYWGLFLQAGILGPYSEGVETDHETKILPCAICAVALKARELEAERKKAAEEIGFNPAAGGFVKLQGP